MTRKYTKGGSKLCKCGKPRRSEKARYCLDCHAAYTKAYRESHQITAAQREKSNVRSYARAYQKNGKLTPKPCEVCGTAENIEKHHPDYSKPLEVVWLCRKHHLELHASLN